MIYFDMDGVLADFEAQLKTMYGVPYGTLSGKAKDEFWNDRIIVDAPFESMPVIEQGVDLLRRVSEHEEVCVLTSTGGGTHHLEIARQKARWLDDQGLDCYPVTFCMGTASKASFATPGAILIDDRAKVCKAWEAAGGRALLFVPSRAGYVWRALFDWITARKALENFV